MKSLERPAVALVLAELRRERTRRCVTVAELAGGLGVSEPTMSRWLRGQGLTLEALDDICGFLRLDLRDLLENARGGADSFTLRQERLLAGDRILSLVFFLVLHGAQRDMLMSVFGLPDQRLDEQLGRLERLGLIDIGAQKRIRPLTSRSVRWRPGGPLAAAFEASVRHVILRADLSASETRYVAQFVRLDEGGRRFVQTRFEALSDDILRVAKGSRDEAIAADEWTALFMLCRPLRIEEMVGWMNEGEAGDGADTTAK